MYADIVFPKGNEREFINMAVRLGFGSLCFVYPQMNRKKIDSGVQLYFGTIATFKTINGLRKKSDLTVMEETDDVRKAVEHARPDIIFGQESSIRSDFIHQRNSGLNHIICRIAKDNQVAVGFSLKSILDRNLQPRVLGRIRQNVKLCRKYGVTTVVASLADDPYRMRAPHDLISLFSTLGMHPKEAKDSMMNAVKIISDSMARKGPAFIAEGIQVVE